MNDKKLLEHLRQRRKNALEQIMEEYGGYISLIVYNTMGRDSSKEDREEAVADVFISLWEKAEQIEANVYLKGYLAAMARNKARDRLRGRALKRSRIEEEDSAEFYEAEEKCAEMLPETAAVCLEEKGILYEAIHQLGEPDGTIFDRYYYFGDRISVIAAKLEMKEGTVKTRLARGRKKLKKILREGGYFDA